MLKGLIAFIFRELQNVFHDCQTVVCGVVANQNQIDLSLKIGFIFCFVLIQSRLEWSKEKWSDWRMV